MAPYATGQRRAKIRLEFSEKHFYERVLTEWKDRIEDRTKSYTINKALKNLKLFPLNVQGFSELRKIRGIGEDIATRLDAAWKHACSNHFSTQTPELAQVKALGKGEPFAFLEATAACGKGAKRGGAGIPFVPRHRMSGANSSGSKSNTSNQQQHLADKTNESILIDSPQRPTTSHRIQDFSPTKNPTTSTQAGHSASLAARFPASILSEGGSSSSLHKAPSLELDSCTNSNHSLNNNRQQLQRMISYTPGQTIGNGNVLLIMDNREESGIRAKRKGKGVTDHLAALNGVNCESRALSVGDYLWVLQWVDWEGKRQELVLDYIIERKTWDDLKKSIRETRYVEQKCRLRKCGLKNVVMVVEGGMNADRSLEQAMVSTSIENGFLVHRTMNAQGTAKFLQQLTKMLEDRCKTERIEGPSFELLQERCKKQKASTIADCWLRQLTVCPGMSVDRAMLVRQRFPTLRALVQFYRAKRTGNFEENQMLLSREIPALPASISKQLYVFFQQALTG